MTTHSTPSTQPPHILRAVALAVAWVASALPPLLGIARCPSARWLHVACPGCGMTRAIHLLLRGELAASVAMNPLAVPISLSLGAVALATVLVTIERGSPLSLLESRAGRAVVLSFLALEVLSVVVWALRLAGLFGGPVSV